tara:strand:+ start:19803 stop:20771 length:969 start_codon:yes stop_codon:yes gene_type:complete
MFNFDSMFLSLEEANLHLLANDLEQIILKKKQELIHGDLEKWSKAIQLLPQKTTKKPILNLSTISINGVGLTNKEKEITKKSLKILNPWRKGPFLIDDIFIDSEWKSNIKWNRIKNMTSPLNNKTILDVGCGNGYYSLRMIGDGAKLVIGIDPSILFMMQFKAIMNFMGDIPVYLLPLKLSELTNNQPFFDTVFSMGVLYHQKSPYIHLEQLYNSLKSGGELVLETIVFPKSKNFRNSGKERYAQMRNVWHIPNTEELISWIKKAGFKDIIKSSLYKTSINEQRSTPWMTSHSLIQALDPDNHNLTIEGYPAPHRIIIVCTK